MFLNRKNTTIISGVLIVIVTIITSMLLIKQWDKMDWIGICFIVIAELVLFGGLIRIESQSKNTSEIVLRSGSYPVLAGYTVVSIILSIVFMTLLKDYIRLFVAIQIIAIAIMVILLMIVATTSKSIYKENSSVMDSVITIQALTDKVMLLQKDSNNKKFGSQLNKLYEAMRFCDSSTAVDIDNKLAVSISKLESVLASNEDNNEETIYTLIDDLLLLMNERAMKVREVKAGGI